LKEFCGPTPRNLPATAYRYTDLNPSCLPQLNMTANSRHLDPDDSQTWAGDFDPFAEPDERRVLFAAFDSYRCVRPSTSAYLSNWQRIDKPVLGSIDEQPT
jgi:hypothetical protein